jgi:hypothetical protein
VHNIKKLCTNDLHYFVLFRRSLTRIRTKVRSNKSGGPASSSAFTYVQVAAESSTKYLSTCVGATSRKNEQRNKFDTEFRILGKPEACFKQHSLTPGVMFAPRGELCPLV